MKSRLVLGIGTCALWVLALSAGNVAADPPLAGYPNSIAAIGDSMSQAANTDTPGDHPQYSWTTGTDAAVNSLYARILAVHHGIVGHNYNDSVSGARMVDANGQAQNAVTQGAELVTILMGANDVCTTSEATMTSIATFQSQFQQTMQTLTTGLPASRIAVVSIPDIYNLWSIEHDNPSAQFIWNTFGVCQSLLANPMSMAPADVLRRANVRQRNIDFNTVLHDVCAQYIHCRFDNYVGFNTAFTVADVSMLDYFHPSIMGQALAAQLAWDNGYDFTDSTAPVSDSTGLMQASSAIVTLSATDAEGVLAIEYKLNSGAYQVYSPPLNVAAGTLLTWRAVDVNGNTEGTHTCRVGATTPAVATWSWPSGDSDCDSFPDTVKMGTHAAESFIGTDPTRQCAATSTRNDEAIDSWPEDFDDNRLVGLQDIGTFNPLIGARSGIDPRYTPRNDLNGDGLINLQDIGQLNMFFGKVCTP